MIAAAGPDAPPRRTVAVAAALVFAGSLAIYLAGMRYTPVGDAIPNELLPIALLRNHSFEFDPWVDPRQPLPYWFVARKGRIVSFYPIVPGLLNVPVYFIADRFGVNLGARRYELSKVTASIVTAASVLFLFLALVAYGSVPVATLTAAVYALGTVAWSTCATALWQHGPSLLFLTAAMACLSRPSSRLFPAAGLMLGFAVWNRPANLVFAVPIAIFVALHHRRRLAAFLACALIPAALLAAYSLRYFGDLSSLGQGHRVGGHHGMHRTAFDAPLATSLPALLFSPGRGLFVFSPVLALAVPALFAVLFGRRTDPVLRWLAVGLVLDVWLFAKWSVWWGGWSFGWRMLAETAPVFVLLLTVACEAARQWKQRAPRVLFWSAFGVLGALSVYANFLGAAYYPSGWNHSPASIDEHPERVWLLRDTELGRCQAAFFADVRRRAAK